MIPRRFIRYTAGLLVLSLCCTLSNSFAAESDSRIKEILSSHTVKFSDTPVREHPGWKKPERVAIYVPGILAERPGYKDWFQQAAGDAELIFISDRSAFQNAARNADVILGACESFTQAPKLRWMQRYGVGVETCLSNPAIASPEILLTNTRGLSGPYIAEHVIAMTMMLSHRMHQYYDNQKNRNWDRSPAFADAIQPVAGASMLVVGLGGIGTKVAEKAAALGMQVNAIRNSSHDGPEFVDYVGLSDELLTLAAKADVVVNTLPLTASTTGLYDKEFFSAMKMSAYFISVGRGRSVVTDDLVAALKAGDIAGVGLDVTEPEPLPKSHPLWTLPNVLITPHTSGRSGYTSPDTLEFVRENLRRYTAGEPLLNIVDRDLGY